jgi:hypothetical protein
MEKRKPITRPLKAIREHCVECFGGQRKTVRRCPSVNCLLWPFRLGKNPFRKKKTETQKEAAKQNVKQMLELRNP